MTIRYEYTLAVAEDTDGGYTATIDGDDPPLRGHGETPIQALTELISCLTEWPRGGADRWLDTPAGTRLARMFCPGFEPGKGVASS